LVSFGRKGSVLGLFSGNSGRHSVQGGKSAACSAIEVGEPLKEEKEKKKKKNLDY
jgi:hypothetical protein